MEDNWIYMDHAAATPLDESVLQAMIPFMGQRFYNPSANYAPARAVADELAQARIRVAHWLGARPGEIIFTAGGTEANNLAIDGIMRRYPDSNIVLSAIEHDAVRKPAETYGHHIVPVDKQGQIDRAELRATINDQTVLVSTMYANNEIGSIQPMRHIAAVVQSVRRQRLKAGNNLPLWWHTDACQAAAYLDLHAARLGVDLMTLNGGKIYGPKQSGVLYVRAGIDLEPLVRGGGQERGLRSGTENVAACLGLSVALDLVQGRRHSEVLRLQALQDLFIQLLAEQVPQAVINGSLRQRLPNNIHLTVPGSDNERLIIALEARGVLAAAGSACSASHDEPSHVLQAIGLTVAEAQASLRFSMGSVTDAAAVRRTVAALADSLAA